MALLNMCSIALYLTLLTTMCVENISATSETMERTLPAYAIALKGSLLNSSLCHEELEIFTTAVDQRKLWALKMLDSSGAAKPGFIYGNNYWLGSRSQCEDASNTNPLIIADEELRNNSKYRDPEQEYPPFPLNYFVTHFRHNSTLQYHVRLPNEDLITLGLCLPASCSSKELSLILKKIFQERTLLAGNLYSADFKLAEVRDLNDDHQWLVDGKIILVAILLVLTIGMVIVGTTYDVLVHQKQIQAQKISLHNNNECCYVKKTANTTESAVVLPEFKQTTIAKVILCFSCYTNTKIILDTKLSSEAVPVIHGLRFLGMMWIIMIHTIFYMADYADNKPWAWRKAEGFAVQVISNSTLSVDTFFFMSGFLVSYLYLNSNKGKKADDKSVVHVGKVNQFVLIILKRFIRLTPAYMMVLGLLQINAGWYGKTSQFYMTERPQEVCAKYWWRNILYINNLFGRETMCMSWSWYLSNDMQFFIIATFTLILSSVFFYTAVGVLISLLISSTVLTGYISYIHEYVPTMDAQFNTLEILYDPPWTRIGPHIIGVATAYILIKLNKKLDVKRRNIVLGWCLGSSCNILVLFGLWERHISVLTSAFYVALSRTVWAVGIAWLVIACSTNHGGIVNKILSYKGFVPLSRLTYCAYLLNPFLINSVYLHAETPIHVDFLPIATLLFGNFVITYFCAYALSLLFETPIVLLMRMLTAFMVRKR
ncbi:nose resistant to fluoxetine protein 6-like [Neodiprion fabricii]|uniref:nose resistant to fluoxetine protein 6-like n=1 Tax=Neodiprion fabricii TaxID=2872261 RepID=UPI001ED9008C|nr:nose resistant to fluoxetine protein 6-like [Neodiprion fabricii]